MPSSCKTFAMSFVLMPQLFATFFAHRLWTLSLQTVQTHDNVFIHRHTTMSSFTDTRRSLHSQTHDDVFIHRHTTMSSFTDTRQCLHSQTHDDVFIHRHTTMSSFTDTRRCLHSQTHDDVFIHRYMFTHIYWSEFQSWKHRKINYNIQLYIYFIFPYFIHSFIHTGLKTRWENASWTYTSIQNIHWKS